MPTPLLVFRVIKASAEALGVTHSEKAVLIVMVEAMNQPRNGTLVWCGQETIARQTGHGERTVRRAIARLIELELIKLQKSPGRYNLYSVNVGLIVRLIDTGQSGRSGDSHRPNWPVSPATVASHTGHSGLLTSKGTTNRTSVPTFGCSGSLEDGSSPRQRDFALLGVVEGIAEKMRVNKNEQPTVEKREAKK